MTAPEFNWRAPDYVPIIQERMRRLAWIREDPDTRLPPLKAYYRDHPADFINDWGVTFDPRNADVRLPSTIPFLLFPKQREWCEWVLHHWRERSPGLTEKSRDCGISWLAVGLASTICLFNPGVTIGFGSRKEEYVDKLDSPKSLFFKARMFLKNLPPEFLDGWNLKTDAPHMRIKFPGSGSHITGEAGDGIGRGDRASIYFVDESAFLERPQLVEASLSQTTNCRIDVSSVNGRGNPFEIKRHGGKIDVFVFDWRDDPRKDQVWYDKQVAELDPVTLAQEVNRDYSASAEGVLIPSAWIQSAVDACAKLGIAPTGARVLGFDVADEGKDNLAAALRHGPSLLHIEEWRGIGDDIFGSVQRVFGLCDGHGLPGFIYDADGLGAGVRGDARVINEMRAKAGQRVLDVRAFRGSEGVFDPEREDEKGRKNVDFFANKKAQAWWSLRKRFLATHRAVTASAPYDPDDIISLAPDLACLTKLSGELSQPTYSLNLAGKIIIDKAPDGSKSPNLADAVMIAYSRTTREPMRIDLRAVGRI